MLGSSPANSGDEGRVFAKITVAKTDSSPTLRAPDLPRSALLPWPAAPCQLRYYCCCPDGALTLLTSASQHRRSREILLFAQRRVVSYHAVLSGNTKVLPRKSKPTWPTELAWVVIWRSDFSPWGALSDAAVPLIIPRRGQSGSDRKPGGPS